MWMLVLLGAQGSEAAEKASAMKLVKKVRDMREEALRIIGTIEEKDMKITDLKAVVK